MAFTVHFAHEGTPISMLLDLVEVPMSHSGVNLAATFAKVLEEFGISDKVWLQLNKNKKTDCFTQILGVTADNASNNDKMIEHLAALIETFPGAANQTRCFAHILNLVAKSVLRQFEGPKKKKVADDAAKELAAVIDEMDVDNDEASDSGSNEGGNECDDADDDDDDDDEDGLPEKDEMAEEDKESVEPIRRVLTKVSPFQQTSTMFNNSFTASRPITGYQKLIHYRPS